MRVGTAIFEHVVEAQPARWDFARHRYSRSLRRQQAAVIGKFNNQGAVNRGLQPLSMMENRIVVTGGGVVAAKGKFEVVFHVVLEQKAFHINFKLLLRGFAE